jgi:hypothetical protein
MCHILEVGFGCLVVSLTSAVRLHAYSLMMASSIHGVIQSKRIRPTSWHAKMSRSLNGLHRVEHTQGSKWAS